MFILSDWIIIMIIAILSYLIGSVNFSIILSRIIGKKDIRESGSGNAGATNMLRTYGKKMGVVTLLLDVAKGVACVLLALMYVKFVNSPDRYYEWGSRTDLAMYREFIDNLSLPYIAGVCVILGHNFPLYFGFKGGKGVATSLGVVLMLDWKIGLIVMVVSVAVIAATRYVSLGSIIGGALYIVLEDIRFLLNDSIRHNTIMLVCIFIIGGLLIARHHANIARLINGTESKLGAKKEDK